MSSFIAKLFGQKNKKSKELNSTESKLNTQSNNVHNKSAENLPAVMERRLSLSKSGRMKEKKRQRTTSVNFQTTKQEKELEMPDKEVFDVEGIIKTSKQSQESH